MSGSGNSGNNSGDSQLQWHKEYRFVLLQEYAKHKREFLKPDVDKDKIWDEIAREVKKQCPLECSASDCCQEIDVLRKKYEGNKNKVVTTSKIALYTCHARYAFELDEDSVVPSDLQTSSSLFQIKGDKPNNLPVLEAYEKYKDEFSSPGVDKQSVWKKIADEIKKKNLNYTDIECCNKIDELKCEYQRLKRNGFLLSRRMAMYMDNARRIFEPQEDNLPPSEPNRLKGPRNETYNRALLQTYAKHKSENTYADEEKPEVWDKIAKEMRDVLLFDCGKSLCQFDLVRMKWQYENFKSRNRKSGFMPYLLDEAQKAFGSGTIAEPDAKVQAKVANSTNKYIYPYSKKRKQKQKKKPSRPNKRMRPDNHSGYDGGGYGPWHCGQDYGYGGGPSEQWF